MFDNRRAIAQLAAYGLLAAFLLICLQLARYSLVLGNWTVEFYLLVAGIPLLVGGLAAGRYYGSRARVARKRPLSPPGSPLTERELEILERVSAGCSNQEIADQLFISLSTVKTHLQSIYAKLEVKRRTQAVDRARRLKLIV